MQLRNKNLCLSGYRRFAALGLLLFSCLFFFAATANADTLDLSYNYSSGWPYEQGGSYFTGPTYQKIIPTQNNISKIDFYNCQSAGGTYNVYFSLYDLDLNLIATSSTLSVDQNYGTREFIFPNTRITPNIAYYLLPSNLSFYCKVNVQNGNFDGMWTESGGVWSSAWAPTTHRLDVYYIPDTINPSYGSETLFYFTNPYLCYSSTTCKLRYYYNENVFTTYDYLEIQEMASATSSSVVATATSTIMLSPDYLGDKSNGLSYFNLATSSTSTVYYQAIGHLAAYWSPTLGNVAATTTIPYIIWVNWITSPVTDITDWIGSSTAEFSTHDLACTPDEWAATTTYLGINFQNAICGTKQWLLDIGIKPTEYIIGKLEGLRSQVMAMFPFSLFKTINDSWTNATSNITSFLAPTPCLAQTFATSTGIYDNGSADGFSLTIPDFIGLGTTTFTLITKASIISTIGQTSFDIYYYSCRAIIWVLTLLYTWHLITERTHEELL